jgi:methionyl-tRNA synthetase
MNQTLPSTAFVSTALPFVNAAPHLGFALELAITDAFARSRRLAGRDVCFVSGTDEHSLKNVLAAERAGLPTSAFVQHQAQAFADLARALDVSLDAFVRTSTTPGHAANVAEVWQQLAAAGELYRQPYAGWYCAGCEQFYEPAELPDKRCPEHDRELERVEEENWFFRLGRQRDALREAIESGRVALEPESARQETLRFLDQELRDLSVSRSAARARGWGIAVPGDPDQVVYVWVDALLGYLTALGDRRRSHWSEASERTHVIGKGITRFHAVYWLAILQAAGIALPTRILVHGYLTVDGKKISKSGSSLDPLPLIARYGSEAVRYYLLRHVRTTRDGDFSEARLVAAHDAELANQLGNLASRVLALLERSCAGKVPERGAEHEIDRELLASTARLERSVLAHVEAFAIDRGVEAVFALVEQANGYVDRTEPWQLARSDVPRLHTVLNTLSHALFAIARGLAPFLPQTALRIAEGLGTPLDQRELAPHAQTTRIPPLFPRLTSRPG